MDEQLNKDVTNESAEPRREDAPVVNVNFNADEVVQSAVKAAIAQVVDQKKEEKPAEPVFGRADVERLVEQAAKLAAEEAAKAYQRPAFAPAIVKPESEYAEPTPFLWAAKATKLTGGTVEFSWQKGSDRLYYNTDRATDDAIKAMATTAGAAIGEHFVPRIQTDVVVEALYQRVVTRNLPGVNVFPMPGLICDIPSIGSFTAGWSAENAAATNAGDAATTRKTLTAKNLTALATISNQLIADSTPAIERYVRNGIAAAMAEAHDIGALYGTGSSNQPLGITGTTGVNAAALGSTDILTAILARVAKMAAAKLPVNPSNVAVLMRPEVLNKALTERVGSSGDFVVSSPASDPRLSSFGANPMELRYSQRLGYQVFATTAIPAATGTVTSSILVLYTPDFVIGDRQEMEIAASNVAGSAFANNQTLIRAIMRVDFLLLRPASLEVITNVAH